MSSALHVSGENGMAHARTRPRRRPCHFSTKDVVRAIASLVAKRGSLKGAS